MGKPWRGGRTRNCPPAGQAGDTASDKGWSRWGLLEVSSQTLLGYFLGDEHGWPTLRTLETVRHGTQQVVGVIRRHVTTCSTAQLPLFEDRSRLDLLWAGGQEGQGGHWNFKWLCQV